MFIFELLPLCIVEIIDDYSTEEDGRLFRHDILTNTYTNTVFKRSPFSDAMCDERINSMIANKSKDVRTNLDYCFINKESSNNIFKWKSHLGDFDNLSDFDDQFINILDKSRGGNKTI